MAKVKWGEKRYYDSYRDDSFMNTLVLKEKKIKDNYRYFPRGIITWIIQLIFYYLIAIPIIWLIAKIKYGVKVSGRKNLKKVKGGAILVSNHSSVGDCFFASVFVAFPKRNYFICNKDAVQVFVGKYFTKTLGALPLPDNNRGLVNLANAVDKILKRKHTVTIYPEAAIWPYYTKVRPMPAASFSYAVRSNVPVVPFAVTYRYAKRNPLKKKPRVNVTVLPPIYPDSTVSTTEAKAKIARETEEAIRKIVETKDNVEFIQYLPKSQENKENENGKDNL